MVRLVVLGACPLLACLRPCHWSSATPCALSELAYVAWCRHSSTPMKMQLGPGWPMMSNVDCRGARACRLETRTESAGALLHLRVEEEIRTASS
ncbi:hypothetical protein NDU88_002114 [Pleurodeles waltl]|uniref:Secreted protein n=1 Tax=Pleurodeles waltl TaxID=8319 RepID=A0AAV7T1D2_PLEWA|nr:hypothetical protein NDU88_002114 [Pleurodeles waltl]